MADADQSNLTTLTVDLLSAFLANNSVDHSAIPDIIKSTHAALKLIDTDEPPAPEEPEYKPAVSARKSLGSKTHIISMIDGKPYQTLKRHLSKHDLTPDQYRERYGLPKTYPMVAPAYSESRREIAKKLGLGFRGKAAAVTAAAPISEAPAPKATPVKAKAAAPKPTKITAVKADAPVRSDAPAPVKATTKAKAPSKAAAASKPKAAAKAAPTAKPKAAPKKEPAAVAATPAPTAAAPAGKKGRAAKPATATPPSENTKPAPRKRAAKAEPVAS